MRDDLLRELETEYEQIRTDNERREQIRRETIREKQPDIHALTVERENLIFDSLRTVASGKGKAVNLPERMEELSGKIREKLKEAGYPEDYLAPIYRCPICKDSGKTGDLIREDCECLKKAYQKKLREAIGLKSRQNETFESFNLNLFPNDPLPGHSYSQRDLMEMHRKTCEEWANNYPKTTCRDLILSGRSGLGKTFLMHSMAERLISRNVDVMLISAYRLLEILRKAYFENENTADEVTNAEILMIDDLGSEPLMQNITVEQLFNLLNERQNRGMSTIISTNLDMNEFRTRYTERIASRLRDSRYCEELVLEGKDIRV